MRNVSVIIPAYNEERTIKSVVEKIKRNKSICEIIVVNNASTDNTAIEAESAGAKTIFCKQKGKGYAMQKGIDQAKGEIILFLDADICNYRCNVVNSLVKPIQGRTSGFYKIDI